MPFPEHGYTKCWKCNFDFRKAKPDPAQVNDAQEELLCIAERGWVNLGSHGPVYSLSYFSILWKVYRLLVTGRFALPLRDWVQRERGTEWAMSGIPRIKEVELLNPRSRHVLIDMAYFILQDWPRRFIMACRETGISKRVLLKGTGREPYALWVTVNENLNVPSRLVSIEDIEQAKATLLKLGVKPTYRELSHLLGRKFQAHSDLAEPDSNHAPYGSHRYWKLDGVSPDVRAAAKKAAHQNGDNIGAWVEHELRKSLTQAGLLP